MITPELIDWLLDSDVSIQYMVHRDLLNSYRPDLQVRISQEGWGKEFLLRRNINGHWGIGFYNPKWISSHYTLLDIKNLGIQQDVNEIGCTTEQIIAKEKGADGGINPSGTVNHSDVCINGMFLNYASYFNTDEEGLKSVVDFIISQQLPDGGFNCRYNRSGANHSSLHSTLSVIEGICEYAKNGYKYRLEELQKMERGSVEFILAHRLFRSHRTGEIIDRKMLMLSWPSRWRYDILRCLDHFRNAGIGYDPRMSDAIEILIQKRRSDNKWPVQAKHAGQTHFDMESAGKPSRWNTMRALRVLKHFGIY